MIPPVTKYAALKYAKKNNIFAGTVQQIQPILQVCGAGLLKATSGVQLQDF